LEERERNLYASQGRNEITIQGLQRDVKYHEEKVREYDKKIRQLELNISEEIQLKERARLNLQVPYVSKCIPLDKLSTSPFISHRKIVSIFPLCIQTVFSINLLSFQIEDLISVFIRFLLSVFIGFRAKVGTRIER